MQTLNNIPYQVNKVAKEVAKEVTLLPIEGVHDKEIVKDTRLTLEVNYLDYSVQVDWQKK